MLYHVFSFKLYVMLFQFLSALKLFLLISYDISLQSLLGNVLWLMGPGIWVLHRYVSLLVDGL
jgi:hypothetical protein